jgi:hypothetical protein
MSLLLTVSAPRSNSSLSRLRISALALNLVLWSGLITGMHALIS